MLRLGTMTLGIWIMKCGTFLLLQLLTRVAFELDASCSFINASCVIGLGIEVEAFRKVVI